MRRGRKWLTCFMAAFMALPSGPASVAQAGSPFKFLHRVKPPSNKNVCVEDLAEEIDWLEHHIASYGTVVAKQPDVWGQARLTKHRHEFEKQMAGQLSKFQDSLQGSLARSDQAYLAQAIALSAAISGPQAMVLPSTTQIAAQSTTTTTSAAAPSNATPLPVPEVADPATLVAGAKDVINRNNASLTATSVGFGTQTIALEPMLHLDQMATYLNHLNELRRLNEGDDTADSPGYALTLVRIPVSVIPGGHTRKGYGAEITVTAEPVLSEELLPTTFRNLVVNDLVDQLSYPLTKALDDKHTQQLLDDFAEWEICYEKRQELEQPAEPLLFEDYIRCKRGDSLLSPCCGLPGVSCPTSPPGGAASSSPSQKDRGYAPQKVSSPADVKSMLRAQVMQPRASGQGSIVLDSLRGSINNLTIPMSPSRRPQLPFPPSQLSDVYGIDLLRIAD